MSEGRSLGIREEVGYTEMLTHLVKHTADKPRFLYYITNLQKKVINNQAKKAIKGLVSIDGCHVYKFIVVTPLNSALRAPVHGCMCCFV